jgi:hypothetical protein
MAPLRKRKAKLKQNPQSLPQRICQAILTLTPVPRIVVYSQEDIQELWNGGCFGTGTLSRSEPTWWARTAARLGLSQKQTTYVEHLSEKRKDARQRNRLQQSDGIEEAQRLISQRFESKDGLSDVTEKHNLVQLATVLDSHWFIRPPREAWVYMLQKLTFNYRSCIGTIACFV